MFDKSQAHTLLKQVFRGSCVLALLYRGWLLQKRIRQPDFRKFLENVTNSVTHMHRLSWVGILRLVHFEDRQCQIVKIIVTIKYQQFRFRVF